MGMKEDNDEITTKTRLLSLELLQVSSWFVFLFSIPNEDQIDNNLQCAYLVFG